MINDDLLMIIERKLKYNVINQLITKLQQIKRERESRINKGEHFDHDCGVTNVSS